MKINWAFSHHIMLIPKGRRMMMVSQLNRKAELQMWWLLTRRGWTLREGTLWWPESLNTHPETKRH